MPPQPAPERLLHLWLDAFNSGDAARATKFEAEHVSSKARDGRSPKEEAQRDLGFRDQVGGGFDLYKVVSSTATEVKALLRERSGFGYAQVTFSVEPGAPDVVDAWDIHGIPTPAELRPARVGVEALTRDVDALLRKLTREDRFSGVVLIARDGKPLFQKAYGDADRAKKIPNRVDTKFRIGSMNKMFTSVAIAQLVQAGKLRYTDTLAQLVPDYPDKDVAAKVTVHHLLTHTSGLGDFFGPEFDKKKDNLRDLKDYLQFFAGKPLKFEPGKGWSYSNAGMLVAGLVVEHVSGQSYFDYVREHVYRPAGMKDTDNWEKTNPQPNQAVGYTRDQGKWVPNFDTLPLMGSSAGGGDSTAPDMLAFDQALRHHVLLDAEHTDLVITGKVDTPGGGRYAYGFGDDRVEGKRVVGHSGGAPGMNATLNMYWDAGLTLIVMANLDPPAADNVNKYIRERITR